MIEFLLLFFSVPIIYCHIITDEIILVIIEDIHIIRIISSIETALEIAGQIIYQYFLCGIDKNLFIIFIQSGTYNESIFFSALSFSVYLSYSFTGFPVKDIYISIIDIVFYINIYLSPIDNTAPCVMNSSIVSNGIYSTSIKS